MTEFPWDKKKGHTSKPIALKLVQGGKAGTQGYRGKTATDLTPKQEAFLNAMLKGTTASQAYRDCYDASKMKPHTIHTEASKLLGHPVISKRLAEGFKAQQERAVHTAGSLRAFIVDRLYVEALNAGTDAARIAALTALGKVDYVGLFKERIGNEDDNRTADEIKQELEERLKVAFSKV